MTRSQLESLYQEKLSTPDSNGHNQKSPTAGCVGASGMIAAKNEAEAVETRQRFVIVLYGTHDEIVRMRGWANQI